MLTAGQTIDRTVQVQNVKTFSLGQRADQAGPMVAVPGLGNVTSTFVDVGSNGQDADILLTITGLNFTTSLPATVLLQPRQNANEDFGFPDQFAVQVISTDFQSILCRIRRIDPGSDSPHGWGQDLRLDILVVDFVNNP